MDTLPANDLAAQVASYRTWRVVNPEPYDVAAFLIEFCGLVAPAQLKGNPHIYREGMSPQINGSPIRVWVNPVAEIPMFEQATPKFPIGSIIVKEKLIAKREWSSTTSEPRFTKVQPIPELLTVMIKRELGFNTDAGDWEFLVYSGDAQSIQGRGHLHNCQRCHVPQSENDYVFRDYLPAEFRKGPTIAPDRRWRLP